MIRYRLTCAKSHQFEGWFASSKAFDAQAKKKLVTCPACGTTKVEKALMAPSVVTSERASKRRRGQPVDAPAPAESAEPASAALQQIAPTAEQRQILREMRKLRDKVLAKSDYVGPRFAEEARRIHTGETNARGIHGEATVDDVKSLAEDGIEVYPVPVLPDDQN